MQRTYMIVKDDAIVASNMPLDTALSMLKQLASYSPNRIDSWELTVDSCISNEEELP